MSEELRAQIVEAALDGLRKAISSGEVSIKGYPRLGAVDFGDLPEDVVKLFMAL